MPLVKTIYGGVCPLEKFDIVPCTGCYDRDPVEACLSCNFADTTSEGFDLYKICQCPSDMEWNEYDKLREQYAFTKGKQTRKGFWEFVKENYKK